VSFEEVGVREGGCAPKKNAKTACTAIDTFREKYEGCLGKTKCLIDKMVMEAGVEGKTKDSRAACEAKTDKEDKFYVKAICKVTEVKSSVFGGKKAFISPQKATYIIVISDICISIAFIFATMLLIRFTKRDLRLADEKAIQLTDFAVLIKGIPEHDANITSEKMKAKFGIFVAQMVQKADKVYGWIGEGPD